MLCSRRICCASSNALLRLCNHIDSIKALVPPKFFFKCFRHASFSDNRVRPGSLAKAVCLTQAGRHCPVVLLPALSALNAPGGPDSLESSESLHVSCMLDSSAGHFFALLRIDIQKAVVLSWWNHSAHILLSPLLLSWMMKTSHRTMCDIAARWPHRSQPLSKELHSLPIV